MVGSEEIGYSEIATPEIPLDSTIEYFNWLKKYHDSDIVESLPYDKPRPEAFDYEGVTLKEVDTALKAVREQRVHEPEVMKQLLRDLSPAQIVLLAMDPAKRLYTDKEMFELMSNKVRNEKERLLKFPDTPELIAVQPGTIKYLHSTPGDVPEHNYVGGIMAEGLYCHDEGLSGVAVQLSKEDQDYNIGVLAKRHREYPGVISIVLPLPENPATRDKVQAVHRAGIGNRVGLDALLARKIPDDKKVKLEGAGIDYDYILPGKFIQGYFDTQKGEFVKNPNFNPQLSDEDLKNIEERIQEFTS